MKKMFKVIKKGIFPLIIVAILFLNIDTVTRVAEIRADTSRIDYDISGSYYGGGIEGEIEDIQSQLDDIESILDDVKSTIEYNESELLNISSQILSIDTYDYFDWWDIEKEFKKIEKRLDKIVSKLDWIEIIAR